MALTNLFKLYNIFALSTFEAYSDEGHPYKGAPSKTTDAKKKRKRKAERAARRINRK